MAYILDKTKCLLSKTGEFLPAKGLYVLESALNYLSVGHWMSRHGFQPASLFVSRDGAFRLAGNRIRDRKVLYLEFGVWKGDSMRFWSKLLANPESMLHGFDSFEGLPGDWSSGYGKGAFSVNGNIPVIEDPRVKFFKGWFDDTVPGYQLPDHEVLFVNCDADLYSSTHTILTHIGPHLKSGDYLYFDEFHHNHQERKAFDEFVLFSGFQFTLVGCSQSRSQVLFARI